MYKIAMQSLKSMCLETVVTNLDVLKINAEKLPFDLINDLHETAYYYYRQLNWNNDKQKLPSKLFINSGTKTIHDLYRFDLSVDETVKKICQNCKQLQRFKCNEPRDESPHLDDPLSQYNFGLSYMDLNDNFINDSHIFAISLHCPQLWYLNLSHCADITDKSIHYLNTNIVILKIFDTSVTPNGCVTALKRLPCLTYLDHESWDEIMAILNEELKSSKTYSIQRLSLNHERETEFDFGKAVASIFPMLRDVEFAYCSNFPISVTSLLSNTNGNIVNLTLDRIGGPNIIEIIGRLCPMLESLIIALCSEETISSVEFSTPGTHVLFTHLTMLKIDVGNTNLSDDDFLMLISNCYELECLEIVNYNQLTDDIICEFFRRNELKFLKCLQMRCCNPYTVKSLKMLFRHLKALKRLFISGSLNVTPQEFDDLRKLANKMQWKVAAA